MPSRDMIAFHKAIVSNCEKYTANFKLFKRFQLKKCDFLDFFSFF